MVIDLVGLLLVARCASPARSRLKYMVLKRELVWKIKNGMAHYLPVKMKVSEILCRCFAVCVCVCVCECVSRLLRMWKMTLNLSSDVFS